MFKLIRSVLRSIVPGSYVKMKAVSHHISIEQTYFRLAKELKKLEAANGWVLHDCDAMLYQGLYCSCTGNANTLRIAEDQHEPGKFYRRADRLCYWTKESASEWSKDMGIGFMWACLRNGLKREINAHFSYGQRNAWVMGKGPMSRTFYTPSYVSLLDQVRFKVNGKKYPGWKKIPQLYPAGLSGYEAHLQVLSIALEGLIYRKIPKEAFRRLQEHHRRKPHNPLFAAVYCRFKGGTAASALVAIGDPHIDDYAGGKHGKIMQMIDLQFACSYMMMI